MELGGLGYLTQAIAKRIRVQFFSHSVELSVFKTFGTPITKTIGHQRVFLFCHLTYFVQLLYLGKLRDLNIMNLALRR